MTVTGKNNCLLCASAKATAINDIYCVFKNMYYKEGDEQSESFKRFLEREAAEQHKDYEEAKKMPEDTAFDDMHPSWQCIYNVLKAFFNCNDVDCLCQSDFTEDPLFVTKVVEQVKNLMDNQ